MGIVITLANQKGGVAKTTTGLALARILSEKSYKVLTVNLDPQRNFDQALECAISRRDLQTPSLFHVLTGKMHLKDIIKHGEFCDIAPASNQMYGFSMPEGLIKAEYEQNKDNPDKLLNLLHERFSEEYQAQINYKYTHIIEEEIKTVINDYDFVIIDTNPSLSLLTMNGLNAASMGYVLVPAYAEETSREALLELYDTLFALNSNQIKPIKIIGILMTKYVSNTKAAKRYERYLTKMADKMGTVLFKTKIRRSISVTEYIEAKTDLLNYDPKGNASLDYRAFSEEFLTRLSELEGKHFG